MYMYMYLYVYIYVYVYVYVCVFVYVDVYVYVCVDVDVDVDVYEDRCRCTCTCICICMYIYIYLYTIGSFFGGFWNWGIPESRQVPILVYDWMTSRSRGATPTQRGGAGISRWGWLKTHQRSLHMSSVQNPCWLMIIGDYTSHHIGDYNNPIGESLFSNQYNGIRQWFSTLLTCPAIGLLWEEQGGAEVCVMWRQSCEAQVEQDTAPCRSASAKKRWARRSCNPRRGERWWFPNIWVPPNHPF